jgi:predicted RecB family nuclease
MWCDRCYFTKLYKVGNVTDELGNKLRVWKCGRCGHQQTDPPPFIRSQPKELYLDIETSPNMAFLWSLRVPSGYVNSDMIVKDWFVISWAASWTDSKEVFSGIVSKREAKRWDDSKILKPLWALIDSADIVIGHNSDKFDLKKLNTRFLLHDYGVPRKYRTVDTLKVARKSFAFESNKLDYLNSKLGNLPKHEMELADWMRICLDGDQKTLDKMVRYNRGDVVEGKKLYARLRDWVVPFPRKPRDGYKMAV